MSNLPTNEIQQMIMMLRDVNDKCTDNMKRLNKMMLELKALVAMIRPQVKKSGWYGEEVPAQVLHRPDGTNEYPLLNDTSQCNSFKDLVVLKDQDA